MYKWHVHSALGRGRPVAADMNRVAEGIAASLRSFSISASRAAEENKPLKITRVDSSRSARSASAVNEISSLSSNKPARGVDARSLAAKPAAGFAVRRIDNSPDQSKPVGTTGGSRGRGGLGAAGGFRGRGGARGRGRGRGGERGGREGREGRDKKRDFAQEREEERQREREQDMMSPEQDLAWRGGMAPREYVPRTTMDSLLAHIPPIATNANINLTRMVTNTLQVMTGDTKMHTISPEERLEMINKGKGTMMWDKDEMTEFEKYLATMKAKHPENEKYIFKPVPKEHTDAILDAVVGGKHTLPQPPQKSDILGLVDSYALRNETYLPEHSESLKAKLRTLLPAVAAPKGKPTPVKRKL